MPSTATLTVQIKEFARSLGFNTVGIATVPRSSYTPSTFSPDTQSSRDRSFLDNLFRKLTQWLDQGFHGSMLWLARDPTRRANPDQVLPGCQSIIVVGMNYFTDHDPDESNGAGRIARYAWGKDYHRLIKKRLRKLEAFVHAHCSETATTRSYVDTGPIMEKPWAQRAGLGWIGKHTNLVSTEFGSWLLLGEVLTTLALEPDEPGTDLCGTCSLCIQACPTNAIVEPYVLDAEKCISYLTIEHRGPFEEISGELKNQMGNRIFGCDDCLDICPYNVHAHPTPEPGFQPTPWTLHPKLSQLADISEEEFQTLTEGSPIRRAKHDGFRRNVKIGLTNQSTSSRSIQ